MAGFYFRGSNRNVTLDSRNFLIANWIAFLIKFCRFAESAPWLSLQFGRKKISLLILERNAVLPIAGKCVSTDAYQPMRCLVQWINYLKLARSVAEKNWDEKNRGGWLVLALVHGGVEKQSYAEERHSWAKWFRPEIRFDPKRYFFCLLSRMPTVYLTLAEKCAHCASNFPICAREPVARPFNSSHRATRHFFFPSPLLYIARNYGTEKCAQS